MKQFFSCFILFAVLAGCTRDKEDQEISTVIGKGQMPNAAKSNDGNIHLVYGSGDSILYQLSGDGGTTFSSPSLVGIIPGLYDFATRGPQIACSDSGVTIIGSDKSGNIFSFLKAGDGTWIKTGKVNDRDTVAKEGLMALGGDGNELFAVWLDIRGTNSNKIVGAASYNGGKTWQPNKIIYTSPDSVVCACCKPSVAVKGGKVYVMFRNWLSGNRDLYLISSPDGGSNFGEAERLGETSWKLNGCPMDGGAIVLSEKDKPQTVWRRHDTIFACEPGKKEVEIGKGVGCAVENLDNKNVYAWNEAGNIICLLPGGVKKMLGKGVIPVIKAVNNKLTCIWEDDGQIYRAQIKI
ncbi:MAG TPA: sialidase family protein [Chitinophagaceae bacterium]|nr:sialidase family protein [Chitinophagaceae bacterium]